MRFEWNPERRMLEQISTTQCIVKASTGKHVDIKASTRDNRFMSSKFAIPTSISIGALMLDMIRTQTVFEPAVSVFQAASQTAGQTMSQSWANGGTPFTDALWPLVRMLQDFALPVGVGVAIYGMIEHMLDNPNGRRRVSAALFGYGGAFLIPLLFRAIQSAFGALGRV